MTVAALVPGTVLVLWSKKMNSTGKYRYSRVAGGGDSATDRGGGAGGPEEWLSLGLGLGVGNGVGERRERRGDQKKEGEWVGEHLS